MAEAPAPRGFDDWACQNRDDRIREVSALRVAMGDAAVRLVEQAGGAATTGRGRIMDIEPTNVHQRVPCMLGSVDDVNELLGHYSKTSPSEDIYQP